MYISVLVWDLLEGHAADPDDDGVTGIKWAAWVLVVKMRRKWMRLSLIHAKSWEGKSIHDGTLGGSPF